MSMKTVPNAKTNGRQGTCEDYFDPYNPYLDRELVSMGEPPHQCIHLFSCPDCGYDSRMVVNQVPV